MWIFWVVGASLRGVLECTDESQKEWQPFLELASANADAGFPVDERLAGFAGALLDRWQVYAANTAHFPDEGRVPIPEPLRDAATNASRLQRGALKDTSE